MTRPISNTPEKFWSLVNIGEAKSCWNWHGGSFHRFGYGLYWYQGKNQTAHRLAYSFSKGSIPDGLEVLHDCDNPRCCNPNHLFPGTALDNNRQRSEHGRNTDKRGSNHHLSKLADADIIHIRRLSQVGYSQKQLVKLFDVSQSAISRIVNSQRWSHIENDNPIK